MLLSEDRGNTVGNRGEQGKAERVHPDPADETSAVAPGREHDQGDREGRRRDGERRDSPIDAEERAARCGRCEMKRDERECEQVDGRRPPERKESGQQKADDERRERPDRQQGGEDAQGRDAVGVEARREQVVHERSARRNKPGERGSRKEHRVAKAGRTVSSSTARRSARAIRVMSGMRDIPSAIPVPATR